MYDGKFIAHVAFWIGCGSFAAYTTVLQFVRYYQNADTPKISYKMLHHSTQEDVYPDITICIDSPHNPKTENRGNVYDNSYLKRYHSLSKIQYNDLMIGNEKAWNEIPNATRVADVNFDEASLTLDRMFYFVLLPDGGGMSEANITKRHLIKRSFQIPGLICFTRTFGSYFKGTSIVSERFDNIRLAPKPMTATAFVHYPGRALRAIFGRDRVSRAGLVLTLAKLRYSSNFQIKLSQMSVLKKRPDAAEPCDPTPSDDKRFWEELFSRIPCLPAYWKKFHHPKNSTLKDCNNFTQYSELNKFTWAIPQKIQLNETESILASLPTPCNEMEISVTSGSNRNNPNKTGENTVDIAFAYNMKTYQEIRNERDFGMESLWSCIGGYIGLFVGCSLLSLLDDGYDLLLYFFTANVYPKKLAKQYCK